MKWAIVLLLLLAAPARASEWHTEVYAGSARPTTHRVSNDRDVELSSESRRVLGALAGVTFRNGRFRHFLGANLGWQQHRLHGRNCGDDSPRCRQSAEGRLDAISLLPTWQIGLPIGRFEPFLSLALGPVVAWYDGASSLGEEMEEVNVAPAGEFGGGVRACLSASCQWSLSAGVYLFSARRGDVEAWQGRVGLGLRP